MGPTTYTSHVFWIKYSGSLSNPQFILNFSLKVNDSPPNWKPEHIKVHFKALHWSLNHHHSYIHILPFIQYHHPAFKSFTSLLKTSFPYPRYHSFLLEFLLPDNSELPLATVIDTHITSKVHQLLSMTWHPISKYSKSTECSLESSYFFTIVSEDSYADDKINLSKTTLKLVSRNCRLLPFLKVVWLTESKTLGLPIIFKPVVFQSLHFVHRHVQFSSHKF